jgi:hypothetical protein
MATGTATAPKTSRARIVPADDDVLLREGLASLSILAKLPLLETGEDHRRVLAVLTFLEAR